MKGEARLKETIFFYDSTFVYIQRQVESKRFPSVSGPNRTSVRREPPHLERGAETARSLLVHLGTGGDAVDGPVSRSSATPLTRSRSLYFKAKAAAARVNTHTLKDSIPAAASPRYVYMHWR